MSQCTLRKVAVAFKLPQGYLKYHLLQYLAKLVHTHTYLLTPVVTFVNCQICELLMLAIIQAHQQVQSQLSTVGPENTTGNAGQDTS